MMKKSYLLFIGIILLGLIGCSNATQEQTDEADSSETEDISSGSLLTDDAGHEVELPESPKKIIAPYLEDDLLTLGQVPIVQWSVHEGESIQHYLQEDLKDIPTIPHDLPFEVVTSYGPDLVLLSSASLAEGEKYDTYSKIAPTFVIESEQYDDWRERLKRVAEVFSEEETAKEKLAEYDQFAEEIREEMKQEIGDESVIALWWFDDTFYVVNEQKSSGEVLYQDLELTAPNVVEEMAADQNENWAPLSLELLAELDADHIFIITNKEGEADQAFADQVFQNIPAVKNGNVYEYSMEESWLYSCYIANTQVIDDVYESLVKQEE